MLIRLASPSDIAEFRSVLVVGAARMRELGAGRWTDKGIGEDRIRSWIAAGEAVVALRGDEIVGVMLLQWRDPLYWPDRPDGEAGYVHKLAVKRGPEGAGTSSALIEWAAAMARELGCAALRLDCGPWPRLCAFYERCGFTEIDRGVFQRDETSVRFERAL